ncbi:MAG: biotin--[acetyl-CoA-carboxylase] ligase, partial [Pseudomonadota bacterium]
MTNDELVNALTQTLVSRVENCNVRVFDELGSTNSLLMSEPVGPVADAQAVLALHQTAGRGRRGRQWRSAPQAGLYASVAYTYDRMPDQIAALTLALGVCVARTLESLGLGDAMLKWPNDLVWQDRKLGGILVE